MRVLLCGLGRMGKRYWCALQRLGSSVITGIVEPNLAASTSVLTGDEYLASFASPDEAILTFRPDAMIIATPTTTHYEMLKTAMRHRLPVLVEKPMCATVDEAREIAARVRVGGVPVMIGHIERFNPSVIAARSVLLTGTLGHLTAISSCRVGSAPRNPIEAGGVLLDLAVHDIDLALWLCGPLRLVCASGDDTSVTLQLVSDATTVDIHASWKGAERSRLLDIHGQRGHLAIDLLAQTARLSPQLLLAAGNESTPGKPECIYVPSCEPLFAELQAFLAGVNGTQAMPITELDGLAAIELADQAAAAIRRTKRQ